MRHDSDEPIWIQVTGPTGWPTTATGLQVSIDNGATWVTAAVDTSTTQPITLATGQAGSRAWVQIQATDLTLTAGTTLDFLVRLTNGADSPVMTATGQLYIS
jgi:hypothetical protein